MSSFISPEEQRRLHRQNVLNARLGILAAMLGIGAAYFGFREAAAKGTVPAIPLVPPVATSPDTTASTSTTGSRPPVHPAGAGPVNAGPGSPPAYQPPAPTAPAPSPEQYVNAGVVRALAGGPRVAIIVMRGEDGVEERLAAALGSAGVNARTGVFTSAAFRNGVVERLAAGDAETMSDLGLSAVSGHLVVGRLSFDPVGNTMDDLMMTHASLSVQIVPLQGGAGFSRAFRARGAGFNESAAVQQAESRVIKDLVEVLSSL